MQLIIACYIGIVLKITMSLNSIVKSISGNLTPTSKEKFEKIMGISDTINIINEKLDTITNSARSNERRIINEPFTPIPTPSEYELKIIYNN